MSLVRLRMSLRKPGCEAREPGNEPDEPAPAWRAAGLRRKAQEAVYGKDMRLRRAEIQGYDGREEFLGRFKRACSALRSLEFSEAGFAAREGGENGGAGPVAPTIPQRAGVV
jgi:hypothetical protein